MRDEIKTRRMNIRVRVREIIFLIGGFGLFTREIKVILRRDDEGRDGLIIAFISNDKGI